MRRWDWGHWILARAQHVGLRTRADLRQALGGVSDRQIDRWLGSARPPRLQTQSLRRLTRALRLSTHDLVHAYELSEPDEPAIAQANPEATGEANASGDQVKRREIKGIADTLSGPPLDRLHELAGRLIQQWTHKQPPPPSAAPPRLAAKQARPPHTSPAPKPSEKTRDPQDRPDRR